MKNAGKIILIVLGAALIALGVAGLTALPQRTAVMDAAVYLEEPLVLPENEGKLVIIHGTPEMTAPVYDAELKLTLNTIKAYRYKEVYKKTSFTNEEEKWEWTPAGQTTLTGEARLGGFVLDHTLLTAFPAESHYSDFLPEETAAYTLMYESIGSSDLYILPDGRHYASAKTTSSQDSYLVRSATQRSAEQFAGSAAYYYRAFDPARNSEMTIAGVQQGDRLISDKTMGAIVHSGVLSREELSSRDTTLTLIGLSLCLLVGAVLVFLGLRRKRHPSTAKEG